MRSATVHQREGDTGYYVKWEAARTQLAELFPTVQHIPLAITLKKSYAHYFQAFVRQLALWIPIR